MFNIYRTAQQDIADARAALSASTESMRAYCAYCDSNGDWTDASDDYMARVIHAWIADMESSL